jgi:hypothetical protein
MSEIIRSLTAKCGHDNEMTVWFPQDRGATIAVVIDPEPFEQRELHLVPLPAQCWNVLASDEGTEHYESLQIGCDCSKCQGPIVKFLTPRPFRHYIAHCRCVAMMWLPESYWSGFFDAAPSWLEIWNQTLVHVDEALTEFGKSE